MKKEERIVCNVALEDISTVGEKVIIESQELAGIMQAEKGAIGYTKTNVAFRPVPPRPRVSLKNVSTTGKKVTIKSQALVAVVEAEKKARTKSLSVVMVPGDPTPEPVPW